MAAALKIRRGDIVVAAAPGDYGKPRPCIVVQSDLFEGLPALVVCLVSSDLQVHMPRLRFTVTPNEQNGLKAVSQVAIDKIMTLPVSRIGSRIGRLTDPQMSEVSALLAVFLGLA